MIKGNGVNHKKAFAILACVLLCVIIVISFVFIVYEADHDCAGNECHVCDAIAASSELFRTITVATFSVTIALGLARYKGKSSSGYSYIYFSTPVSQKTKLIY